MYATLDRYVPSPDAPTLLRWGALLNAELLATLAYVLLAPGTPTDVLVYVYPWVWIDVALWAVLRTRPTPTSRRVRWASYAIGVAYFLLVGYAGGLYHLSGTGLGLSVHWLPLGWGPAPIYSAGAFTVVLMPFKVAGYAALASLVSCTVRDASASALSGLLGLVSCVSCAWPVLATIATGIFGSASVLTSITMTRAYGVSTVVFVASVLALTWRPTR
ncbi:ABC transporter, ATP-binding protein homolog [Halarchaeum acidiphilum MH1-52-1]|uniref:ABC transporter, ATP-binding protein homolog n=1 Tax=Halarchaeum acidiphilum MH1-52-1 TaxID=1261545 RepID=U2YTM5_9EURY|nr:hypothetical protein [Halarchaeum acidiphilum]GAD52112.1 ABC transporter, ATP-binding protein homolog [Halarchaeum acidiphilum MH1-52-1]